jgi:hypothetical protein
MLSRSWTLFPKNLTSESSRRVLRGLNADNSLLSRDSTLIMQLLRDNLTLWTSDMKQDDEPAGEEKASEPAA